MFVTNFAYSCRSSCSRGVNCGGAEFVCEVDKDIVEAMAVDAEVVLPVKAVEIRRVVGNSGQVLLR